jgi:hypothetical protein
MKVVHRTGLLHEATPGQGLEKLACAPVEDRRLGGIELDQEIVDLGPSHGGEDVLDRVERPVAFAELGSALGLHGSVDPGRDRLRIAEISPSERHPLSAACRPEGEAARLPQMQPNPFQRD